MSSKYHARHAMIRVFATVFMPMLAATSARASLEAHEWGTFTSLVGSNGITQNGMYHEDEPLPAFVHGFGETVSETVTPIAHVPPTDPRPWPRCPRNSKACLEEATLASNTITQKMETPVIYFYSDVAQHVDVNVRFPEGIITETFPGPVRTSPSGRDHLVIANGNTTFAVNVLAPSAVAKIPAASGLYAHARDVASNFVQAGHETEKFIFYRGLGRFQPELQIISKNGALTITDPRAAASLPKFLVHVDQNGDGRMLDLTEAMSGKAPHVINQKDLALLADHNQTSGGVLTGRLAHDTMVKRLANAGLYIDEAQAMINTWEHGYLHVPGLRLLYVLPRAQVDQVLPLQMTPTPDNLVRVFVGRIEILLDTQEQKILQDVVAEGDAFRVEKLGRFAEPMLRRVLEVYANSDAADAKVIATLNHLIALTSTGADGASLASTSAR